MFHTIMLAIDMNHPASWAKALPAALDLAARGSGTIHLAAIVPDFGSAMVSGFFPADFEARALTETKDQLEAWRKAHIPAGVDSVAHVGHGHVPEQLLKLADACAADLIVMGSHKPDEIRDFLIGSNADRVVRHAHRSVLVVRGGG